MNRPEENFSLFNCFVQIEAYKAGAAINNGLHLCLLAIEVRRAHLVGKGTTVHFALPPMPLHQTPAKEAVTSSTR